MTEPVTVWYDPTDSARPWLVKRGDAVTRAAEIEVLDAAGDRVAMTATKDEGFHDLQPGGPRGVLVCDDVLALDEVPV